MPQYPGSATEAARRTAQVAMTPLLPPAPPLRSYTDPYMMPEEVGMRTFLDLMSSGVYENLIRPISSPMGMGITAASMNPTAARAMAPIGSAAMGASGAYNLSQGNYPQAATELGFASVLGGPSLLSKYMNRTPGPVQGETVDLGRREFLKKAGPVAASTAAGAPAALELAGKLMPKGGKTLIGMEATFDPYLGGWSAAKSYRHADGSYSIETLKGASDTGYLTEAEVRANMPQELLDRVRQNEYGTVQVGENPHMLIHEDPHAYRKTYMQDSNKHIRYYER